MWLTAAIIVALFLAVVSSLIALARFWPAVQTAWSDSLERARREPRTSPRTLVRADSDQARPDQTDISFDQIADYLAQHNLTDEQLITLYARARRAPDDYPLSANKIRDAVGGSRDEILAAVAAERPRPKARPAARMERPANGWGKAS